MEMKGILIVGHGSRYDYNKNVMELQAKRLREKGFERVYIGFNEASEPSIEDAMISMARDGIDDVMVIPFFIASGLHMTRDIPPKIGLASGVREGTVDIEGRSMNVCFEKPFGNDPLLARILRDNISEASGGKKRTAALIIGHGSKLGYNQETVEFQTEELRKLGLDAHSAFNEFNEPKIEETMERLASEGADEIIVAPLFISLGDHLKNDVPPKIGLKDGISEGDAVFAGRTVGVKYLLPIGEDPRLTEVLAEKIAGRA